MTSTILLAPTRPTAVLPPAGPAWFPSVMGTAILALLIQLHLGGTSIGHLAASCWLVMAWVLLVGLSVGFVGNCRRDPERLRATLADPSTAAMWGTVSMGILATGSATLAVGDHAGWAVGVDLVMWVVGSMLGLATAVVFGSFVARGDFGRPTMVWGLAVVPPMVMATAGATLAAWLPDPLRALLRDLSMAAFVLALLLAAVVFAAAYHHHLRVAALPIELSATSWIPLGVVGQSMAAAAALSDGMRYQAVAHLYGYTMLLLAVPVVWFAARTTIAGFRVRMPFATNWWALTFPIGTLSLGAHLLGEQTGQTWITAIGWLALAALIGTWTFCAATTLRVLSTQGSVVTHQ